MNRLDRAINVALLVVACIATATLLTKTRQNASVAGGGVRLLEARALSDSELRELDTLRATGRGESLQQQLIEVLDIECPFCGAYSSVIDAALVKVGGNLSFSVLNFPLPQHKAARVGAAAIACAEREHLGEEVARSLLANQDSLALRGVPAIALASGVRDRDAFESCLSSTSIESSISRSIEFGRELGVRGTPALILSGVLLDASPTGEELETLLRASLAGGAEAVVRAANDIDESRKSRN